MQKNANSENQGFFSKVWKNAKNLFKIKSKTVDHIIVPAHSKNACFVNAAVGALSNMEELNEQCPKSMEDVDKQSIQSETDTLINDLKSIKREERKRLSPQSKKLLGFNGKKGQVITAVTTMLGKLKIAGRYHLETVRNSPDAELGPGMKEKLQREITASQKVTYFLCKVYKLRFLNHVYCLHQYPSGKNQKNKYVIADDKGFGLNYSAQTKTINQDEAEYLILNRCIAYVRRKTDDEKDKKENSQNMGYEDKAQNDF